MQGRESPKAQILHRVSTPSLLDDNAALLEAASSGCSSVLPVFILDPEYASSARVGARRFNFLLEALRDLDSNLKTRYSSRLVVLSGEPVAALSSIFVAAAQASSADGGLAAMDLEGCQEGTTAVDGGAAALLEGSPCTAIFWEEEAVEPYGRKRDAEVLALAEKAGVTARAVPGGHHLWDPKV